MRIVINARHVLALLVAAGAASARGDVRLEGQERRVEVGVWVYTFEGSDEPVLLGSATGSADAPQFGPANAPHFGPFERSLEVLVDAFPNMFPPNPQLSEGIASQSSTITPGRFHGS